MKKKIGIVLLLVSGVLAVYLMCFFGGAVRFETLCVDEERYHMITDSRRYASGEELLDELFFDEQQLFFDASSDTFYYSLEEDSRSAYNPRVEIRAADGMHVAVLGERILPEDVRAAETMQLIAYNESAYREYHLVCTTLPLMNIESDTQIGDEDVPVHMTLFDNSRGAAQRLTQSDGAMHIRGGSTRTYPKKGYKLSLTKESLGNNVRLNKVSLLGMRQDDDWILYAAYNDPEKIRNVFSSALWKNTCAGDNALGIDNGMEYRYVELFLNNEYWGLYALGYPIDDLQLSIDASKNERLYKKSTWDSEDYMLSLPDVGVAGYKTDEDADNAWSPLKEHFAALHAEWDNAERMYEGIDIDNAVDMYLFLNLIQGIDHVGVINSLSAKNMFLSFHKRDGREIALYTPWDMDITWGLQWTGDAETNMCKAYGIPCSQNTVWGLGNLPSLILNGDDEIWSLIFEKYWKLREDLWSEENLNALLDGYEEDIYGSGAFLRDMERWENGSYWDADKGLTDFRAFVAARLRETDDYYRRVEALVSGKDATTNVYIVRSAQYKDFLNSDFLVAVNDTAFLENSDYVDFLSYIGVDIKRLKDGVRYAVVRGADKKAEYFESLSLPEGVDTCIGNVRIEEDAEASGSCRIFVDHVLWRTLDLRGQNGVELVFDNRETQETLRFDFSREYIMWSKLCEDGEPARWCAEVKNKGCDVLIEIVNHDMIKDKRFLALLEEFGVDTSQVSGHTDFIAVSNTGGGHSTILNDSHVSGARFDTVVGAFSIFYNDEGGYGVYMDGNECILVQPQENEYADVRVSVFYREPYEVVWCPEFCYD